MRAQRTGTPVPRAHTPRRPEMSFRVRFPPSRHVRRPDGRTHSRTVSLHLSRPSRLFVCRATSSCMGCGSSSCGGGGGSSRLRAVHNEDLYLPSTELRFNVGQMRRLNDHFLRGHENSGTYVVLISVRKRASGSAGTVYMMTRCHRSYILREVRNVGDRSWPSFRFNISVRHRSRTVCTIMPLADGDRRAFGKYVAYSFVR